MAAEKVSLSLGTLSVDSIKAMYKKLTGKEMTPVEEARAKKRLEEAKKAKEANQK